MKSTRFLAQAGAIAAIYLILTLALQPLSYGLAQVRVSEALCVLPCFTPAAIPGLFIGCLLANLLGSAFAVTDMLVGGAATLIAALITRRIRNKWLAPLPAVLVNAVFIGAMLSVLLNVPFWSAALYVGGGQAVSCYVLGVPLYMVLRRYGNRIFGNNK